jgi:antitoxin (DNA-binding transcriptional repressor) of toxin-antitoxin stability system
MPKVLATSPIRLGAFGFWEKGAGYLLEGGGFMEEEIVPVSKFKETCVALLDKVKSTGRPILVTRQGEPIALISPPPKPEPPKSWLGSFKSKGRIMGDIISPALDEKEWEALRE